MEVESGEAGVRRVGTRPRLLVLHAVLVALIAVTAVTTHVHIEGKLCKLCKVRECAM